MKAYKPAKQEISANAARAALEYHGAGNRGMMALSDAITAQLVIFRVDDIGVTALAVADMPADDLPPNVVVGLPHLFPSEDATPLDLVRAVTLAVDMHRRGSMH